MTTADVARKMTRSAFRSTSIARLPISWRKPLVLIATLGLLAGPLAASAEPQTEATASVSSSAGSPATELVAAPDSKPALPVLAAKLSAFDMYRQADHVVKSIMLLLLACSLLSWTVWIGKVMSLGKLRRRLRNSLVQLQQKRTLLAPEQADEFITKAMLQAASEEVANVRKEGCLIAETLKERVGARICRIEVNAAKRLAHGTGVLASIAAVAPFVGLLGTVWGIMNSFTSIAQQQTTNLAVVAPGIAEALLATAIGLFAAIPAVVLYNMLSRGVTASRLLVSDASTLVMCQLSREIDYLQPSIATSKAA